MFFFSREAITIGLFYIILLIHLDLIETIWRNFSVILSEGSIAKVLLPVCILTQMLVYTGYYCSEQS